MMKKCLDLSQKVIEVICILSLSSMSLLAMLQVFYRYVLHNSLTFSEELIRYLFVWTVFLGAAILLRKNGHAALGFLVDKMQEKYRQVILSFGSLVTSIFVVILVFKGFELTFDFHRNQSVAMGIPMSFVYAAIPVGSLFMFFYSLEQLYIYLFSNPKDYWEDRI